jgi:hypothetical protein
MNNTRVSIAVTTESMYRNLIAAATESVWDGMSANLGFDHDLIEGLVGGDMEVIREAFKGGSTAMLLTPEQMETVSKELEGTQPGDISDVLEIRVYHGGKIIGVVLDNEINF